MRGLYIIFCFTVVFCLLSQAEAATYVINGDMAGEVTQYKVKDKDTLYSIARESDVGIVELMSANPGIDPWIPKVGTVLTLPTAYVLPALARKGIVIDLSELR
jgi:L,D-transpeptidase ErfK/SrfK